MSLFSMCPRSVSVAASAAVFALCATSAPGTAQPAGKIAKPDTFEQISEIKAERKRAAAEGNLPLPGTPDLARLDERLAEKNVPSDASMLIRIFKAESELEVWMTTGDGSGRYELFAKYPICFWSGGLGPKLKEGDRQAPEGFYTVDRNLAHPNGPRWPEALDIGYPNPFDQVNDRTGSSILIHGGCASIGCYAMSNAVADEVRNLSVRALDAGQTYIPINIYPFRMTAANLALYADSKWTGFWNNLKEGYDIFERTRRTPRVAVCNARYEFKETDALGSANPGPLVVCPTTDTRVASFKGKTTTASTN
jgi:murein L,D-transpeptidase YafK